MKTLYLTDKFGSTFADPDGIQCYLTGEHTHYYDMYHSKKGKPLYVSVDHSTEILNKVWERKDDIFTPLVLTVAGVEVQVIDIRFYKVFYPPTYEHPDYKDTGLEDDERWLSILPPVWEQAGENENGIETVAFKREHFWMNEQIVGYNGILEGDSVLYKGVPHTVVMVSRLGDFGLSLTGKLPYIKRVAPNEVTKIPA